MANRQVENLNKAFAEGFHAFKSGKTDYETHYDRDSLMFKEFQRGWNTAYFEQLASYD